MADLNSSLLLPFIVLLPLIAALSGFLSRQNTVQSVLNVGFACLLFLAVAMLNFLFYQENTYQSEVYEIGRWGAPLGIDLLVDGFSMVMISLTGVLTFILTIYSTVYYANDAQRLRFWPLWWLLIAGLNALFVSADAFNIYVCLEIIVLSAAALVALQSTRAALQAALRYLLVGLLGSLFYLMAIVILYRSHATLDLAQLAVRSGNSFPEQIAMILITIGLLLKIALFPLHFWLPPAHANAPTPVSAILSALVVKASLYLLIKFWFEVLSESTTFAASQLLGCLGAAAIIYGSWKAFRATQLKVLVAYSTVGQLGYIFLLFPLSAMASNSHSFSGLASQAAVYFIVAHACAKAAMFLSAGNLILSQGTGDIARLKGIAAREPVNLLVFAIAGVSLIGLPPSAGFIAKWLLLTASIESGQWWWVIVVLCGGLITAIYLAKILNLAFTGKPPAPGTIAQTHPSRMLTAAALVLALITLALGLNAELILNMAQPTLQVSSR